MSRAPWGGDDGSAWRRVWILGIAQVTLIALTAFGLMRVRADLVIAGVVFGVEALRAARRLGAPSLARLAGFMAASFAVVLVGGLWADHPSLYVTGLALTPLLLAWPFVLQMVPCPNDCRDVPFELPTSVPLLLLGAAVLWIFGAVTIGGVRPWNVDEVLYLLQAQRALHPPFMHPIDPSAVRFFQLELSYVAHGNLNGQYPPGWPLLLSMFPGALRVALPLLLHLWMVAATYAFGRLVSSARAGYLAAILVATSGFELEESMSFFPHMFTACLLVTSAVLMVVGARKRGTTRMGSWATAGMLQGLAFATRPLTALALGAALAIFVLVGSRITSRRVLSLLGTLAFGAAGPIAYLMWYNHMTTGGFLRFGYTMANHGFQSLGFGLRGFITYKGKGLPIERVAEFGPGQAARQLAVTVQSVTARLWPGAMAFPLLFLARQLGVRPRLRSVLPFALLPLAYAFYFFPSDRYMFSLLPFAMVGTAWLVRGVWREAPKVATALAAVLVCIQAAAGGGELIGLSNRAKTREPFIEAVESVHRTHPKVLVFVDDTSPGRQEPILEALYAYNLEGSYHGDVVVARDLGAADQVLETEYPDYYPVRLSLVPKGNDPWLWRPRVTPIAGRG
jgi:hypothetical protein